MVAVALVLRRGVAPLSRPRGGRHRTHARKAMVHGSLVACLL